MHIRVNVIHSSNIKPRNCDCVSMFELIVAYDLDGCIGLSNGNTLPWYIPEDLAHFRKITTEKPDSVLVMGRNTFESLGGKTLSGRIHIVLTTHKTCVSTKNVHFADDSEIDRVVEKYKNHRVFIIGGRNVYDMFFDRCHTIHLTTICIHAKGDIMFPRLIDDNWTRVSSAFFVSKHRQVRYQFHTYQRPVRDDRKCNYKRNFLGLHFLGGLFSLATLRFCFFCWINSIRYLYSPKNEKMPRKRTTVNTDDEEKPHWFSGS